MRGINHKGGYLIIDLAGVEIDSTGVKIDGIYDRIEGCDKPILLRGINNDGTEMKPRFVAFDVSGTDYVGNLNTTTVITVEDDDTVSITDISE